MEGPISPWNRELSSDRTPLLFDQFINYPFDHDPLSTEGEFGQPRSTASPTSLYPDFTKSHGRPDQGGNQDVDLESFNTDPPHFSFEINTSFTSQPCSPTEFTQLIESMPEQGNSIMVASASDGPECLDDTNQSEKSSLEEASASISNTPAKTSKAGKIGRPPKRRSVDAHNNTDRPGRPGKRRRPGPTLEELDKCSQNGDITANKELGAESPIPELPFRPEDIEALLSPVDDSPLSRDFVDTIVQYFAACNTYITAISGDSQVAELVGITLSCDKTSIFILSVDINRHSISMAIHVARRNAITVGQYCEEDQQKLQQLASRFVKNRLPEPFNNWDDDWSTQHDTNPPYFDARNSQFHYLWVVMNTTVGKSPPPFDHQLLRSYLYAICVIINHLAGAATAPDSGGPEAKSAANQNGDTFKTLWDVFSSTDKIQKYHGKALSKAFERFQSGVELASFADDDSRRMFLRTMADSYRSTRASELELDWARVQAHTDHLTVLTDGFCDSSMMGPRDHSALDNEEATLRRIEKDITSLKRASLNWTDEVAQALRNIAEEKREFVRYCWLREALRVIDVHSTSKHVDELREEVKRASL